LVLTNIRTLPHRNSPRTETDFGKSLRETMAKRNEALQQPEITAQTEAAMAKYRTRIQAGGRSGGVAATPQASIPSLKSKGSMIPPSLGQGGTEQVAKELQAVSSPAKVNGPSDVVKEINWKSPLLPVMKNHHC